MRFVFKPLLLVVTVFNVFLFVSLFGHRGEGRPMLSAYLTQDSSNYHLSDLILLQRVVMRVESDYVDPDRVKAAVMLDKALERIQRDIPSLMFIVAPDKKQLTVTVDQFQKTIPIQSIATLSDLLGTLKLALSFVEEHLKTDMPLQEVEYSAINGILSTLDPHSILLPPEMAREMDVQIQGEFGGLGITISLRGDDNLLTVISTLPDTPAARSGIKAGDQILQIEEESTINMSLNDAVSKLRGPVGSPVNIMLNRTSWGQPKALTLKRETIKIDSIESAELGQGVGYIHIKTFQHNTSRDLIAALNNFRAENGPIKGLVLDLRNNPGGPLQQAIEVTDRFVESGTIVTTVKAYDRDSEDEKAIPRGTEDHYPIVVVVDSESASASEIVAGALKNLDRAVVVGDQTFGKGSVQNLYSYPDDAKLKLTMAKYLTPGRKSIQSVGITPDIRLVPVYFDKKVAYVYSTGHIFREKDLDSHFEEVKDAGKGDKPLETVRYYSPTDFKIPEDDSATKSGADKSGTANEPARKPESAAADATKQDPTANKKPDTDIPEIKKPDPRDDFQVQFARDLILKAGKATRKLTLDAARGYVKSVKDAKEDDMQKQFANLGIDWTQGKSVPPALVATVKVGDGSGALTAGQTVSVEVTVTNRGKQPAYRVRAISDCDLGTFKDLEFLFGKIDPGASRTWSKEVKVPQNLFSLVEPLNLKLFESAEIPAGESDTLVTVNELPHPTFAYNLVAVDDGSGKSKGNGDGKIQRGESVDLVVLMKNIGDGAAQKAFAKVQNKSGKYVYLTTGTANLKKVDRGEWVEGRFHFQVKDGLEVNNVSFDMVSGDAQFLRWPKDEISLPVEAAAAAPVQTATGFVKAKSGNALNLRGGASEATTAFAQVQPGTVMQVNGKLPGWVRVSVPWAEGALNGWISETAVENGGTAASPASSFTPVFSKVPPVVVMPIVQRDLPNTAKEVELKGEVRDNEAITSMYVFVNNKKRYLHAVQPGDLQPVAAGGVRLPFTMNLPLDEGSNTIEVYARDKDKIQSLDIFQIYREKQLVGQQAINDSTRKAAPAIH